MAQLHSTRNSFCVHVVYYSSQSLPFQLVLRHFEPITTPMYSLALDVPKDRAARGVRKHR